jgi:hypothetical protein
VAAKFRKRLLFTNTIGIPCHRESLHTMLTKEVASLSLLS